MNQLSASVSSGPRKMSQALKRRLDDSIVPLERVKPSIASPPRGCLSCWKGSFFDRTECIKYLLIPGRRGVEISQRYGERWSRFVLVSLIYAFHSVPLRNLSPSGMLIAGKPLSLSMICTGMSAATDLLLSLGAKSMTVNVLLSLDGSSQRA